MFVHLQPEVFLLRELKALRLHPNRVEPNRQEGNHVVARFVGLGLTRNAGALRRNLDRRSRNHGTGLIRNRPRKTGIGLAMQKGREGNNKTTRTCE